MKVAISMWIADGLTTGASKTVGSLRTAANLSIKVRRSGARFRTAVKCKAKVNSRIGVKCKAEDRSKAKRKAGVRCRTGANSRTAAKLEIKAAHRASAASPVTVSAVNELT